MANANTIKDSNGNQFPLEDIRISTGTSDPVGGKEGDIHIQPTGVKSKDGWKYVVRQDGWVECWKTFTLSSVSVSSGPWSGCYHKALYPGVLTYSDLKYPVEFTSVPIVNWGYDASSNTNFWLLTGQSNQPVENLMDYLPPVSLVRASSGTVTGHLYAHVLGRVN